MSSTKQQGTPGPWHVRPEGRTFTGVPNGEFPVWYSDKTRDRWVATVHAESGVNTRAEAEANARVIAAAPDMLEALRLINDTCDVGPGSHPRLSWTTVDSIRALLARIDGREDA